MDTNWKEVSPAEYVKPGFFQEQHASRPGVDGSSALAMAYHLKRAGVSGKDFSRFCQELSGKLQPDYHAATIPPGTRNELLRAAESWKPRCPAVHELFQRSVEVLTDGKALAALVVHLERIVYQLGYLWIFAETG